MTITLFGTPRDLPIAPWALFALAAVLAIFILAFLWKILRSEEGFLFGYGNWVVGKWQGMHSSKPSPAAGQHYDGYPSRRPSWGRAHDLQTKADVLNLSRLLDGDLAYLMMNDAGEWEPKISRALQTIVSGVVRVVHPSGRWRCGFFILDDAEEHLVLVTGEGYDRARRPRLGLNNSCAGRAFQTGEDYYCRDIESDPSYWHSTRGNRDFRSIACVPVRAGPGVFGILCLDAEEADAFTPDDFFHLEVLAAKLAVFCAFHTLQVTGVCSVRPKEGE